MNLRKLVFLATSLVAVNPLFAKADFRKATWGMTQAQVMATESSKPVDVHESNGEVIVQYDAVKVAALDGRVVYVFAKDKLVRAKYILAVNHSEPNDFIGDFHAIEALLTNEHGKPAEDRAIWEDAFQQQEPKSYLDQDRATATGFFPSDPFIGQAIAEGHLRIFTRWEQSQTKILHALSGANGRIVHQVEFARV